MTTNQSTPADLAAALVEAAAEAASNIVDDATAVHVFTALQDGQWTADALFSWTSPDQTAIDPDSLRYTVYVPAPADPGDRVPVTTVSWRDLPMTDQQRAMEVAEARTRIACEPG